MTQQQALAAKSDAFTPEQMKRASSILNACVSKTLGKNGLGEKLPAGIAGKPADVAKTVSEVTRMVGDLLVAALDKYEAKLKTATANATPAKADAVLVSGSRENFADSAVPQFMSLSAMSAYRYFCWAFYEGATNKDAVLVAFLNRNRRQLRAELSKMNKGIVAFMEKTPWQSAESKPAKAATPTKSPRSRKAPEKATTRTTRAAPRSI